MQLGPARPELSSRQRTGVGGSVGVRRGPWLRRQGTPPGRALVLARTINIDKPWQDGYIQRVELGVCRSSWHCPARRRDTTFHPGPLCGPAHRRPMAMMTRARHYCRYQGGATVASAYLQWQANAGPARLDRGSSLGPPPGHLHVTGMCWAHPLCPVGAIPGPSGAAGVRGKQQGG